MSDIDIKRLNNLTDELEQRVKKLETKKSDRDEIITITENAENLLFKPQNNAKTIKFNSNKKTFAVVGIDVISTATFNAQFEVYANEQLVKSQTIIFPFSCELAVQTKVGENVIKIVIYTSATTASFKLDIKTTISGQIEKKEDKYRLGVVESGVVYLIQNDVIKAINTNTMETVVCYSNRDYVNAGYLQGNYTIYLIKDGGSVKTERHSLNSNDSYRTNEVDINFTDCAIDVNNGVTYFVMVKGESVYMYAIKQDGTTFLEKLPFKAKTVRSFKGQTGRYLYYVDLRGNFNVVKHKSYHKYEEVEMVSLGKMENANLSEENDKLMVLYKQGLVVLKRPVFENAAPVVVGVGDEAVIADNGVTIVRKKDKLIKI